MLDFDRSIDRLAWRARVRQQKLHQFHAIRWTRPRAKLEALREAYPAESWPWTELLLVGGLTCAVATASAAVF